MGGGGGNNEFDEPPPLPKEIAAGLEEVAQRDEWNKRAPPEYGLPTETWREHIARRQHYNEVRRKLAAGEIASINDFVTYNLDIEKFAEDAILCSEGPELVRAFWNSIRNISILDPTVGSGAFLFAALKVLEPLYNACLDAMRGLLDDLEHSQRNHRPDKMSDFRKVLEEIEQHPSERYFVLKSIVINNLYGVDLMEEAVEICKLRLFLKLAAQIETYEQIEPLPDIDFNVRPGNTLVGFTSMNEVKETLGGDVVAFTHLPQIEEQVKLADRAFHRFRDVQMERNADADQMSDEKRQLRELLDQIRTKLDEYLASCYDIDLKTKSGYTAWQTDYQPFHWFVEFYGIMERGGFDVVIGNPPYIARTKVSKTYEVKNIECSGCPDIYAWVLERSQTLLGEDGRTGMIVPLSLGFSRAFDPCRRLLLSGYSHNWFSSFGRIPSALFSFDVRVRNTIALALKSSGEPAAYTTRLHRWFDDARGSLFEDLRYAEFQPRLWRHRIPKIGSAALLAGFEQLLQRNRMTIEANLAKDTTKHVLHFKQTAYNWLNYCRTLPPCFDKRGLPIEHTKFGRLHFDNARICKLATAFANGKLMFCFWAAVGDDFDVTASNFADFPLDLTTLPAETSEALLRTVPRLEKAMSKAVQFKRNAGKNVGNYNLALCRDITDVTDKLFLDAVDAADLWDDLELSYTQCVRTDFSAAG